MQWNYLSVPKCHCPEWIGTSYYTCYRYKEGTGFGERWELDRAHNLYTKMNYDFLNNYLYLYLYLAIRPILLSEIICIQQILLSGIICMRLYDKI